jgi:hypothetical protein
LQLLQRAEHFCMRKFVIALLLHDTRQPPRTLCFELLQTARQQDYHVHPHTFHHSLCEPVPYARAAFALAA